MKNNNLSLIAILLLLAGEILVIFSFFILVPETGRNHVFYLNICVVTLMYLVIVNKFLPFFGNKKDFGSKIGGLGISWIVVSSYISFAFLGIIVGASQQLHFKIQLLYQTIFFFGFLVGLFVAFLSASHAVSVSESEQDFKSGVLDMGETITSIEIAFATKTPNWTEGEALVTKVKEKIRFLTASDNAKAKELESNILNEANQALNSLLSSTPDQQLIIAKLISCDTLLNKRKQFFIN